MSDGRQNRFSNGNKTAAFSTPIVQTTNTLFLEPFSPRILQRRFINHKFTIQGAAKKMTQHQKCDNSVRLENFCANFCVFV